MKTKMTVLGAGVALIVACAKPYVPTGAQRLDVSGVYDTAISVFSTRCAGISAQPARIRVEHSPAALTLKLLYDQLSYDAKIDGSGNFRSEPGPYRDGNGPGTAYIVGKFTDSGFTARVYAKGRSQCEYQLRWVGTRL